MRRLPFKNWPEITSASSTGILPVAVHGLEADARTPIKLWRDVVVSGYDNFIKYHYLVEGWINWRGLLKIQKKQEALKRNRRNSYI